MEQQVDTVKVLLIGGTSNVGKTTIALQLADELGWSYKSTDQLARHPGRPWRDDNDALPEDVLAHYSALSVDELIHSAMQHYRDNVWPIVDAIVRSHLHNPFDPCLIVEGSAILPDAVLAARYSRVSTVWLTAADEVIASRITKGSRFEKHSAAQKQCIDSFISRSLKMNQILMQAVSVNGQKSLDAGKLCFTDKISSNLDGFSDQDMVREM